MSVYIKDYYISYNGFEGSFEVFYLLIKTGRYDIALIELARLTSLFLTRLNPEKKLEIYTASEFALYVLDLILFKIRKLLGVEEKDDEIYDLVSPDDIGNIVEYALFKEIAKVLEEIEERESKIIKKESEEEWVALTPQDLLLAFMDIVKKEVEEKKDSSITLEVSPITVGEKIEEIEKLLEKNDKLAFPELFSSKKLIELVVIFLAILELARLQKIDIKQNKLFGTIYIRKKQDAG